jgi:hypothetical protein
MDARRIFVVFAVLAMLAQPGIGGASEDARQQHGPHIDTHRTFALGPGREWRWFTFRERSGVILLNRITVPAGSRVRVDARIPRLAGATVWSWPLEEDPSISCHAKDGRQVCTQAEEWCPMPAATWHFHLVKLSGPAGAVRFDFVVAPPPNKR